MSKKKWITPKLVILVRGRPEELVLVACKTTSSGTGTYPNTTVNKCLGKSEGVCRAACFEAVTS